MSLSFLLHIYCILYLAFYVLVVYELLTVSLNTDLNHDTKTRLSAESATFVTPVRLIQVKVKSTPLKIGLV